MEAITFHPYSNNDFQSIITPESNLFFDMDGTLIETTQLNNFAYKEAFKNVMGFQLPITNNDRITRQSLQCIPNISKDQIDKIVDEKNRLYSNNIYLAQPISSTVELLECFYKQNNTYLVTKARIDRANETISYFGLRDRFKNIISSNAENKYSDAISRLGIDPSTVIVFENEEKQIQASLNAGISINKIIKVSYGIIYNSTQ